LVFNITLNNTFTIKRFIGFILTLFLTLTLKGFPQGITLEVYPTKIVNQNESVQVRWAESITATIYFGLQTGSYNNHLSVSGANKIEFVPSSHGLTAGIYYCRISNGLVHSREFPLYIDSEQAPNSRSPVNGDVISTISPKFEWDSVPGIPFYHLILSDQAITLSEDDQGELQIEGANIIYSAITEETAIDYGAPDPSGYYNQINGIVPPLLNNKTYNWIILNNYGNTPALSSIVQSGVQSFTVNVPVNLETPLLISPVQNASISSKQIEFSWQPVNNAHSYQFELFELLQEDGSTSTLVAWQIITTATRTQLPARTTLKNNFYEWHVIAFDATGKGVVSERRNFTYQVPFGELKIFTFFFSGNNLGRVNVNIKPIYGSGENVDYSTTDTGKLNLNLQPGSYELFFSKTGFRDTVLSAEIDVYQTSEKRVYLKPLTRMVSGAVLNQDETPIANAQITAIDLFQHQYKTMICDLSGKFRFPLSTSIYGLFANKPGYTAADTIQIDLMAQSEILLTTPLIINENTSKLIGKVTNQDGGPVYGVLVQAKDSGTQITTRTDMNGAFQLTIGSGTWDLFAQKVGYSQETRRTFSISENQTIFLSPDLILNSESASINGFISDTDKGIEQVKVSAISVQGNSFSTLSNAKGLFAVSVPSGSYDLHFHQEGYVDPLPQHIELFANQNINNLTIIMSPTLASVSGTIMSNSVPLHNAIISNGSAFDTSRINGLYELKLSPGAHQLQVIKPGYYQSDLQQINLASGELLSDFNIELSPRAAIIKGRVISNNKIVPYALVKAIQNNDTLTTFSDTNGEFLFSVAPGIWKLQAFKEAYQVTSYPDIAVQPEQTLQGIEINLSPNSGIITGQITDSQNNKLAYAFVVCQERKIQAFTNNDGNYTLSVSPGTLSLSAFKEGYSIQFLDVSISSNQTKTLNFSLFRYGTVLGKITDPTGTPIQRVEVLTIQSSDSLKDFSDYAGEYELYLPAGSYTLHADKLGYAANQQQVTLQNGQLVTKNIELQFKPEEIAQLSGFITVDNQFYLPGVLLIIDGRTTKEVQTDLNGNYLIQQLETQFGYNLIPIKNQYFFTPLYRSYTPLSETKTGQNFVATLYGDLSNNQEVSSFDGSLVLRIAARKNIAPQFTSFPRDSLAADVSGNKKVSSFDASLIFRYTVGLIDRFPVQEKQSFPKNQSTTSIPFIIQYHQEMVNPNICRLTFFGSELPDFFSFDAKLKYAQQLLEPISISPSVSLKRMYKDWSFHNGELFASFAGTERVNCTDTLFTIDLAIIATPPEFNNYDFEEVQIQFDEGEIPVLIEHVKNIPDRFYVSKNYPNPFNHSTVFKVWIPEISERRLSKLQIEIYNILGQKVKTIINQKMKPGYYSFRWSSDSDNKTFLATGLYLVRVKYAQYYHVNKMILVK
jgi:uncharacterized membrane protein